MGAASCAERLRRPALWLVLSVVLATLAVWPLGITAQAEPRYLILVLNILFVGVASGLIAVIAGRSFLRTGSWPAAWLGIGALTFGLAGMTGSAMFAWATPNAAITAHNLGCLLSALLHAAGACFVRYGLFSQAGRLGRRAIARHVYLGPIGLFAIAAVAATRGALPPFFLEGGGGTPLRQAVLVTAALLFLLSGASFWRQYRRTRSTFLYWYSLGLLLAALGMAGLLMQTATGTPLNWLGRGAQLLSGGYLLMAAAATMEEARARHVSSAEALAMVFGRQEASLRLLLDSVADAIITTDERFLITGWNRGAERVYGWQAEEVIGRPAGEILATDLPSGIGLEEVRDALWSTGAWREEVVQRRKDGTELVVLVALSALRDEAGNPVGVVAVNHDITERTRAEEQLTRSNARITEILASIQDDFYVLDREWRFVYASELFTSKVGKRPEDFIGNCIWEMFPNHLGTVLEENYRAAMERRETRRFEVRGKYTEAWYRLTAFPSAEGITCLGTDISEQKEAEEERERLQEQLLAAERARAAIAEDLNNEIAHRVKNNLAMISGLLQMQVLTEGDPGTAAALKDAVARVRTFATLHEQMYERHQARVDLLETVRHITESTRSVFGGNGTIEIGVEGEPFLCSARDATNLSVLTNELLTNALKYGAPNAAGALRVTARVAEEQGHLTLSVWNSGEMLAADFDPEAKSRMGLRLVTDMIARYEGQFSLGPAEGGTRARIAIPVHALHEAEDEGPR